MNVDRLPDGRDDDPEPASETTRLTEPTQPETPPPPETSQPKEDPQATEGVHADDSPETASSSPDPAEAQDPAESRSRQEHADPPSPNQPPREAHQEKPSPDNGGTQEDGQALTIVEDGTQQTETHEDSPWEEKTYIQQKAEEYPDQADLEEEPKDLSESDSVDLPSNSLTDEEHIEREVAVFDCLTKARDAELATDYRHTTDPDRQQWTPQRDAIHGDIVRDIYERASEVPCEYRAIIVGGLGGAGKTTILEENAGIDLSGYLIVNPDNIKEELARRGLVPEIEGLTPMEASDLAHEESSAVAKQLARRAQLEGKNLIWDITMSSEASTQQRIDSLRSAGYTRVDGIFVEISIETSIRRTEFRHREGHDKYRAGVGLGGRYVPPEVIRRQADPEWGCKNRKTFEKMKPSLNNWDIHDNSVDGRSAILIETSKPKK